MRDTCTLRLGRQRMQAHLARANMEDKDLPSGRCGHEVEAAGMPQRGGLVEGLHREAADVAHLLPACAAATSALKSSTPDAPGS